MVATGKFYVIMGRIYRASLLFFLCYSSQDRFSVIFSLRQLTSCHLFTVHSYLNEGCRDAKRAEEAVNAIKSATQSKDIEVFSQFFFASPLFLVSYRVVFSFLLKSMSIDLTSMSAVEAFVREYKKRNWPLHVLILNAGRVFYQLFYYLSFFFLLFRHASFGNESRVH